MDVINDRFTSWGKPPEHREVRVIRRFNRLLHATETTGEWLAISLSLLWVTGALTFLLTGNFENLKFEDGTTLSCVLDGQTGEIRNVR